MATFIIAMMLPFHGKGQEIRQQYRYYAAHVWSENPNQPNQYLLVDVAVSPSVEEWGAPFNFFTVSTCNKFSLRWLYSVSEPNSTEYGSNHPVKWQVFRQNGTLYGEYLEPEVNIIGEWETNYGNSSSYSSGITPDFEITEPGTYYLYCMDYENEVWIPNEPTNSNSIIIQVLQGEDNNNYAINAPDSVCYSDFLCWSITPYVNPSRIISTNWAYLADPCEQASPIGLNTITVSFTKLCTNDTVTISKNINVTNFMDFALPVGACLNQAFNVGNITLCDPATPIVSCTWNWGDGSTSNTQYANHSYSNPGIYNVQLTLAINYYGNISTSLLSKTITIYPFPSAPIVTGNFNTCTNPGTFTITNPEANITYNWISTYNSGMSGTNTTQNITWNTTTFPLAPNYGLLTVIADNHGCRDTSVTKIWNCCNSGNNGVLVSNTTITSLPNLTNQEYYFNGTVVINNNINLQNTNINFGPEAKIIVNAPYTFTTNFSVLKAGCNYMWDGIYVNSTQSSVEILNSPRVSDAYNAVNSTNGGKFKLKGSTFQDNFIALKVTDYRPTTSINHSGFVSGCFFNNQTNMIAPYLGQKTHTGVYVDNVYNLRIGESEPEYINSFNGIFCGIQSYNSYLTVKCNKFDDIQKTPLCTSGGITDRSQLYCETAIHVAKKEVPYNPYAITQPLSPTVTIGGGDPTSLDGNAFTRCDRAYSSFLTKQTINNNNISYCKNGITCQDVYDIGNIISNNTINNSPSGIYLISTRPYPIGITIENNTFNSAGTYCIRVLNYKSTRLKRTNILNNTINYNAAIANGKGILAANCDAITITGNTISSATLSSSGLRKVMRGVNIENSPNAVIKANTINKFGTAIYAEGMLAGTQLQCNTMYQNYYGIYMPNGLSVATVYSDQGTSAMPNDNKWTADHPSPTYGIPTYRITGDANSSIPPKYWYYKTTYPYFNPNITQSNPAYAFVYPTSSSSTSLAPCNGSKGEDDNNIANMDSTFTMESIIPDNANLAVQMRYLYMSMLFNSNAEQYATEITQDEQSLYQNIPLIAKINDLSQNDTTIDKAIALNNTLAPVNEMETYRKFVNDIYLNYVTKGVQPSAELIDELYNIADMAPNIGGEAVYIARAILNYEPIKLNKQDIILPLKITANDQIQFYPNPANDILNISFTESFVLGSKIELFDITGRMIYSSTINAESNNTSISLKEVKQGLYLCVIKKGEEILSSSKISVIKQ